MRGKYFVIFGLLAVVGSLAYVMVRLQQKYLAPKVKEVELLVPEEIDVALPRGILEDRARQASLPFRTGTDEFEVLVVRRDRTGRESRDWNRFFVKGVNLGAALPGRYPSKRTPACRARYPDAAARPQPGRRSALHRSDFYGNPGWFVRRPDR